jgi:hypothetical protein
VGYFLPAPAPSGKEILMRDTWYVLEDGRVADPADVVADESGKLFGADGVAVAMRGDTYSSRSVEVDEVQSRVAKKSREMKPEAPKRTYKTRELATRSE